MASRYIFYQMPYTEFETCLKKYLFSKSNETVSYFAEVRRYLYHFIYLFSTNQPNYSSSYKKKLASSMKETSWLYLLEPCIMILF